MRAALRALVAVILGIAAGFAAGQGVALIGWPVDVAVVVELLVSVSAFVIVLHRLQLQARAE